MSHENDPDYMCATSGLPKFRIVVDGMYYCGELENETYTFGDPFSQNSFHTTPGRKSTLEFSENSEKAKLIEGRNNLVSHVRKILDFILCGSKLPKEIKIEREPFDIPLNLNVDYFLGLESDLSKQKVVNQEMKKQLDIATDLGEERFKKIQEQEKEIYKLSALRAERDALAAKLKSAEHEVHEILLAALSGDCERYLSYDLQGNKYCKWGIVSKDIKAVFYVTEPSDIEGSEPSNPAESDDWGKG